jgi:hypothetical protein
LIRIIGAALAGMSGGLYLAMPFVGVGRPFVALWHEVGGGGHSRRAPRCEVHRQLPVLLTEKTLPALLVDRAQVGDGSFDRHQIVRQALDLSRVSRLLRQGRRQFLPEPCIPANALFEFHGGPPLLHCTILTCKTRDVRYFQPKICIETRDQFVENYRSTGLKSQVFTYFYRRA